MKLNPDEVQKLVAATSGREVGSIIDDACELLTMKFILFLRKKRKALQLQLDKLEMSDMRRPRAAGQCELLGQLTVELAESP